MTSALTVTLLLGAIVLCAVGIWALVRVGLASKSLQTLAEDLEERLVPLAEKADVTVDAMNAELLRVDMIVTQVEEVSERVSSASNAVATIVNVPGAAVNEFSDRLRKAIISAKKAREE